MSNTRQPNQPGQGAPYPPQQGTGYPQQQGQYPDHRNEEEEVLDGSDLEILEEQGPPTDPAMDPGLEPGDTDPVPGYDQGPGYSPPVQQQQQHQQQQQQQPAGYPQQPAQPGYPPQAPAGYPAQPSPRAVTMPPDSVQYAPQPGHPPAQPGYPPQQQQQQQQQQYPPPHVEEDPTSQQNQAAIQAAIEGVPYTEGPKLQIIGGNNRGREFPLNNSGDTTIGRGVDNHIILADIAVSRKHTLVCFESGQFVVRDLGSGNGTLLNGRRVDSRPLKDGDQIELGNTLIRYVNPMAVQAAAPIAQQATDVLSEAALIGEANAPAGAAPTPVIAPMAGGDPRQATSLAVATQDPAKIRPAGGKNRSRKLLIFGGLGLVIFFGAMFGLKMVLGGKSAADAAKQQGPSPDEVAAQEFQEGTTQYRTKNWEKAQTHFLKVLKLAPKFEDARRYADQAASELKARDALGRANNSLKAKDYKAARLELSKVSSSSVYAGDVRKTKQKVDDDQLTELIQQTKKLKEAEETEAALAKITEARDLAPTNQVVKDLYSELSSLDPEDKGKKPAVATRSAGTRKSATRRTGSTRSSSAGSRRQPRASSSKPARVKPIRMSGSGAKQALGLYKQQQWAQAFQSIKSYASAQSGSRKRKAESLADAIRKVGQNWLRAKKSTSAAQALKYYQAAMTHDRKVTRGGMHQATLKDLIFKQARKEANTALARGKYTTAFAAYKLARRYGRDDAALRRVADGLESKAQKLFTKAYTKRSSNIAYARKLWQQVLKMVPPSSSAYQKSYKWLNESTPSYQDEDED